MPQQQKPDFCPYIYSDGVDIFLEFDHLVLRFPLTEGGLSKVLKHVPNIARQPGFLSGGQNISNGQKLPKVSPRTLRAREAKARAGKLSENAKSRIQEIIKKME